jgi:tetratricopeptide (TPR) repeat protein
MQALKVEPPKRAQRTSAALSGPDQQTYTEAIGLLQRINNEESLERAIRSLESLLSNARDSAAVNGTLGKALLRKYSLTRNRALIDQASVYAERAVQLDASEPEAHVTLGELRRVSGHLPEAAVSFQRALVLRPDSLDARIGLADTFDAMGRAADADRSYRMALVLRPEAPDVYGHYGRFCYGRGRYEEAARLFATQTELLPDAPRAWSNLGAAQQALGQYEAAMRAYQRSITIHPTSSAFSNLGSCQFYLGHYADAVAAFEKATTMTPDNYLLWANLGDAYRWTPGQREKSLAVYQRALALIRDAVAVNSSDALAHAIAASCLAKRGNLAAAQTELSQALRADPTNANALYHAAVIANLRGDTEAAVAWITRAVAAGYSASDAARDPELANLRKNPGFLKAVYAARTKS